MHGARNFLHLHASISTNAANERLVKHTGGATGIELSSSNSKPVCYPSLYLHDVTSYDTDYSLGLSQIY